MRHTISNSFHGTVATTKYSEEERERIAMCRAQGTATEAEVQAMRRAHNKLCGNSTCTCSNGWGERK